MSERNVTRVWGMRGIYFLSCILLIFIHLLPLDMTLHSPMDPVGDPEWTWYNPLNVLPVALNWIKHHWAGPDLIAALTFVWIMRRPDYVPVYLVALIGILSDFLFQRPPGLWAALLVSGAELLRNRLVSARDMSFLLEWFNVAIILLGMTVGYRIFLTMFFVDQVSLGLMIVQLATTLAVYPAVAAVSQWGYGVKRLTAAEVHSRGGWK